MTPASRQPPEETAAGHRFSGVQADAGDVTPFAPVLSRPAASITICGRTRFSEEFLKSLHVSLGQSFPLESESRKHDLNQRIPSVCVFAFQIPWKSHPKSKPLSKAGHRPSTFPSSPKGEV